MKRGLKLARKIRKKKTFLKSKYFWISFGSLAGFFALVYLLVFSPWVQLQSVVVKNAGDLATKIQEDAASFTYGRFLFFPTRSVLFLNEKETKERILFLFPELETVSARTKIFSRTLLLEATRRVKTAVFCNQEQCASLDKKGVVFAFTKGSIDFTTISFLGDHSLILGIEAVDPVILSAFFSLIEMGKVFGVSFVSFSIVTLDRGEARSNENWKVIFDPQGDVPWQLGKLKAVLDQKLTQAKRKTLEYIDLRFGDQAYLKYH